MNSQIIYKNSEEKSEKGESLSKSLFPKSKLNPPIQKLCTAYYQELVRLKQKYTPVHVDEVASYLAKFYEKIRKIIDWKDDNALRRGAIERILKRILFPKLSGFMIGDLKPEKLAETITIELVRGGHLPNDAIPHERIAIVAQALEKYMYFLEFASSYKPFEIKQKINFTTFVLEIAACEIEEILTHPTKEYELIRAMTKILEERIKVYPQEALSLQEKQKQIYIATLRTLYDLDDNFIIYQLLKRRYQNWTNLSPQQAKEIAPKLPAIWKNIQLEINQPITRKFEMVAEQIDVVFVLLDDILEELKETPQEIKDVFENKKKFIQKLTQAYKKRYQTLKTRLFRLAIFSTLSVFLSNWFTFYLIEVPMANLFYEGFNLFTAIVDFLIPTAVMFFLVSIIRPPKKDNLNKVIAAALGFVYQDEKQEQYQIRLQTRRFSLFKIIMSLLYLLAMAFAFSGIAFVFYIAKLPMTSVIFDTFTIALTVFAAVVIKNKAKELNIYEHTSLHDFLLDIVAVPVAKAIARR